MFFHVKLKKKPKRTAQLRTVLTVLISVHKQEMTTQSLGRKMVHMKNSSKKKYLKNESRRENKQFISV